MRQRRALRQYTLSTGKSIGRNSSGRIMVFQREGIVERIEYVPNHSSQIAPVRWTEGGDPRIKINHDYHLQSIFILFPAWEGGSKKDSLLLSWMDGNLCSVRPFYQNAFLVEEPLFY
ncbi:hypothetical protein H5410_051166 [Solanum commersonii]|uniref:Uncharacterized protein n=1 Tax=Solanum commersonii TaxID=4109 RepID=A0A9J5WXL9_SOLCO|nr:hypothetical protein H5410_051166 [Solanum commersonii]